MSFYPLQFQPKFKYRIWGGDKLKTVLNKTYTGECIGESWEISDVKGDETTVLNGDFEGHTLQHLIQKYKGAFVGEKVYAAFGDEFPLLIKFIDAKLPLSIQVHPSDEIAKKRHNSFGKNEMWYVLDADKNAELIVGFKEKTDREAYLSCLNEGTILDILNVENVEKGDTFYIPTGRIHAIGAGVLLAEIQQTSDITYRIFDYNRVDATTGKERELHNDLAIDVIDFDVYDAYKTPYEKAENVSNKLVHSPYFISNFVHFSGNTTKNYADLDSFVIYICVGGSLDIKYNGAHYALKTGETMLFPAAIDHLEIFTDNAEVLEVYL